MEDKNHFLNKIRENIEKYDLLHQGDRVLVGLSGGADSVCLLLVLKELCTSYDLDILACHVHHGIRGDEAKQDLTFCEELCRKMQVPFEAVYLNIPALAAAHHRSEEEEGRIQRYTAFSKMMTARHFNKLALAHHMDDQAETILHNLVRGTGLRGLASLRYSREMLDQAWENAADPCRPSVDTPDGNSQIISAIENEIPSDAMPDMERQFGSETADPCRPSADTPDGNSQIISAIENEIPSDAMPDMEHQFGSETANQPLVMVRPLLGVTRYEIEEYLSAKNESYCNDSTNASDDYLRNKIRHHVLPYLNREINAGTTRHLAELSETAGEAADFIEEEAEKRLAKYMDTFKPDMKNGISRPHIENLNAPGALSVSPEIRLDISFFAAEPSAIVYEGLRQLLAMLSGTSKDIGRVHFRMIRELAERQTGAEIDLPYSIKVLRSYDKLIFTIKDNASTLRTSRSISSNDNTPAPQPPEQFPEMSGAEAVKDEIMVPLAIPGETVLGIWRITAEILENAGLDYPKNRYTKWFDYDKMSSNLNIRYRSTGDFLTITGNGAHQSLSDYLINEKVPARERDSLPLLAEGREIHWVIGYRIGERAKVSAATRRILCINVSKKRSDVM